MKQRREYSLEIPPAFLDRMAEWLGDEYPDFLTSLQQPSITGLRVNPLKITPSDFQAKSLWKLKSVPWCPTGFILPDDLGVDSSSQPGKHFYHSAGLYYLQEPSAMAAAEILAPRPDERVLDVAAAPGGKATHLAALMQNRGMLVTNEIHSKRFWELIHNLERCGVTNTIATCASPQTLSDHFGEYFDRVLLDAPCSGEGMFRKGDIARREWKPHIVRSCAIRQYGILEHTTRMLKVGGHLVYSTCTFSPEENEGVIANLLAQHPEFELVTIQQMTGFSPARPDWVALPTGHQVAHAVRLWPHLAPGEGHFIARLIKIDSSGRDEKPKKLRPQTAAESNSPPLLNTSALAVFDEFCAENLLIHFDHSRLVRAGDLVYLMPELPVDIPGVPLIHYGWLLGKLTDGRFNPSHALAMGIKCEQAAHKLNLAQDDPRLAAYVAGETILDGGENDWVLICLDDFPMGWGKRVNQVIKNFYPHQLRRAC